MIWPSLSPCTVINPILLTFLLVAHLRSGDVSLLSPQRPSQCCTTDKTTTWTLYPSLNWTASSPTFPATHWLSCPLARSFVPMSNIIRFNDTKPEVIFGNSPCAKFGPPETFKIPPPPRNVQPLSNHSLYVFCNRMGWHSSTYKHPQKHSPSLKNKNKNKTIYIKVF